jgi:hypothetical protein
MCSDEHLLSCCLYSQCIDAMMPSIVPEMYCRQTFMCTGWCTTRQAQQTWTFRSSNTGNPRCQLGSDTREGSAAKFSGFALDRIVSFHGCTIGQHLG